MINLNIASKDTSQELLTILGDLGLFVTHFNSELHVRGTDEQVIEAQAFINTYDLAAGKHKDVVNQFQKAIQVYMDTEAQSVGYDNILSACSYAAYENPYKVEGQNFLAWRGNVWQYCYNHLELIKIGSRENPTIKEFILELPKRSL